MSETDYKSHCCGAPYYTAGYLGKTKGGVMTMWKCIDCKEFCMPIEKEDDIGETDATT
jgi:hypothetical protein